VCTIGFNIRLERVRAQQQLDPLLEPRLASTTTMPPPGLRNAAAEPRWQHCSPQRCPRRLRQ